MPVQHPTAHQSCNTNTCNTQTSCAFGRTLGLSFAVIVSAALSVSAIAAPTVIVNNPDDSATSNNAQQPADPQVAPQPSSPFNQQAAGQDSPDASNTNQNALNNPNSLASDMQPSDADLSAANQELLGRNAQLQRDVNDLETRVNVLINERSGQLFMYGAVTVAVSLFLGFLLGGFVFSRRERW